MHTLHPAAGGVLGEGGLGRDSDSEVRFRTSRAHAALERTRACSGRSNDRPLGYIRGLGRVSPKNS
jgi:hypothetical protein